MAKVRIVIERSSCIGCGNCADTCPEFWEMDGGGVSHLKGSKKVGDDEERILEEAGCNMEAAEGCPAGCIHVYKDGKKVK